MITETTRFLLIYDHRAGHLLAEPHRFVGAAQVPAALDAYDQAEEKYADQDHIEVLLVGAESLDSVKATHGRFFRDPLATA